jgi:hypothetical protein
LIIRFGGSFPPWSELTVRSGNNSTAFVDISVRGRIQPAAADELFLDYRDFDNVRRQSRHPRGEGRAE